MPLLLRFVRNYLNWEHDPEDNSWLLPNEIPADPLSGLSTNNNSLSVYLLDEIDVKLKRCVAAFAANRNNVQEIHYLIFDEKLVDEVGIKRDTIEGKLCDEEINKTHQNLSEISSQKLVALVAKILDDCHSDLCDRIQVCQLIKNSIQNGWINEDRVNKGIKKSLNKC